MLACRQMKLFVYDSVNIDNDMYSINTSACFGLATVYQSAFSSEV